MINENSYIVVPAFARTKLNLSGYALFIYSIIHGFSRDGDGIFTGSLQMLASWCGCSRITAIRTLGKLVDDGLIIKSTIQIRGVSFPVYSANTAFARKQYQNDTREYQNDTRAYQNDTTKYQNDTTKYQNDTQYYSNIKENNIANNIDKNILCDFEQSHRSLDTQTGNNSSNLSENGSISHSVGKDDKTIGSTAGTVSAGKFDVPVCRRKKYDYSQNKLFEQWWSLYPANRRVDKPKCYARFCALSESEQQKAVEQLRHALTGHTNWTRDNNFYCPLSTTYLNQERWEQVVDEIPESCRQSCGYKRLMPQTQENPQSSGKDDGLDWGKMKFL